MKHCNISQEMIDSIIDGVVVPSSNNLMCRFYGIPGSGKTLNLKYILDHIEKYTKDEDVVNYKWIWIDFNLVENDILEVVENIEFEDSDKYTLILDNFENILKIQDEVRNGLISRLYEIFSVNRDRLSFLFLTTKNFSEKETLLLGKLGLIYKSAAEYFMPFFDDRSIDLLIEWFEKEKTCNFKVEFKEIIKNLVGGDPRVTLRCLYQSVIEDGFEAKLINAKSLSDQYEVIGDDYLDDRFNQIIEVMDQKSIHSIVNKEVKESDFVYKIGVIHETDGELAYYSPLFKYFIQSNRDKLLSYKKEADQSEESGENSEGDKNNGKQLAKSARTIKHVLTGQELLVFDFLSGQEGEIVSKEDIAKNVWGDDWAQNYSEWALDKMISRLSNKLKKHKYPKVLKVVKGRGVVLL